MQFDQIVSEKHPASDWRKRCSRRPHLLALILLLLLAPIYLLWSWDAELGQLGSDGPSYLMMADHYAHGDSGDPVYGDNAAFSRFPPLYPLLLSWSRTSDNIRAVHLVTTTCFILALIALYFWLVLEGTPPEQSALLVFIFSVLPGSWLAGLSVQSEYLYLFLSIAALGLISAYDRSRSVNLLYGAAMVVALAILTRTIGIALLAPLLLSLLRARGRASVLALMMAVLPVLLWYLLHRARMGYTDALSSIYHGDKLSLLYSQLAKEIPALRAGFAGNFALHSCLRPIADLLGILCLAATAWRIVRLKPDAIYIAANLLILTIWPFPEEAQRFLWVLVPLMLAQPLFAFSQGRGKQAKPGATQALGLAIFTAVFIMVLPAVSLASDRFRSAVYTDLPEARKFIAWYGEDAIHAWGVVTMQTSMINSMRGITDSVPATDCVVATRPDLVNYFGRRRSFFPPLNSTEDPYFGRQLRATGCRYVFVMASLDGRYPIAMFPMRRLGSAIDMVFYSTVKDDQDGKQKLSSALIALKAPEQH